MTYRMTDAGWTAEKPTVAGWYWFRCADLDMPYVLYCYEANQGLSEALVVIQKSCQAQDEYSSWLLGITEDALQPKGEGAK